MGDNMLGDLLDRAPGADAPAPAVDAPDHQRVGRERRPRPAFGPGIAARNRGALREYQRSRATVGLVIIALVFVAAWLLNGYFTARLVAGLWGDWAMGITVHLVTTVLEVTTAFISPALRRVHAPLWVHLLIWCIVQPFGVFDTGTSALGFVEWGLALGVPMGLSLNSLATVLALAIAFVPEPMLVWLVAALWSELRV